MKRTYLLLLMLLTVTGGCAERAALIRASSTSMHTDIFEERTNGGPAPPGYTDLLVAATLKTHKPGAHYIADSHGTPDYRLLLNIDGQALLLRGRIQRESSEPKKLVDPEAGDGDRYRFGTKLRLKAGAHRVVVALPDDGIAVEREVSLAEGKNDLVLEPVYGTTPGKMGPGATSTSFREGINGIRVMLNGRYP